MPRTPTPKPLKIVRGDRPSRIPQDSPEPESSATCPNPPEHLSPEAAEVWERYAPMLHGQTVLTDWDQESLAVFCRAVILERQAFFEVNRDGLTVDGPNGGRIKHPSFQAWTSAAQAVKSFSIEFGMTPASRNRIVVTHRPDAEERAVAATSVLS